MSRLFYKFLAPVIEKEKPPHFRYLDTELLRFTQPSDLNDPFECRPYGLQSNHPEIALMKPGFTRSMKVRSVRESILRDLDSRYGILSLSDALHSSAMWAHYAADHTGICIGFDLEHHFFSSPAAGMKPPEPVRYRTRPVNYEFRADGPDPEILYTKALEWSYEEEWRMVVDFETKWPDYVKNNPNARKPLLKLYKVPFEAVRRIVLGERMKEPVRERIFDWAKAKDIEVFVSAPNPDRFEMDAHNITEFI